MSAIFTQYVLTLVATLNCAFSAGVVLVALLSAQSVPEGVPIPRPTVGLSATFPTGHGDLSEGDYFVGPFAYGAKRWFHRLVLEGDLTAVVPLVHGASTRQVLANAMVAVMLTPRHFDYPVYAQVELDTTTFLDGSAALPPGAMTSPAATLFIAPEIFIGPFKTPINDGTRLAAGVSFELAGDPVHRQTYMFTAAFDIPNKYGY